MQVNVKSWYANEFPTSQTGSVDDKKIESIDTSDRAPPIVFNNCYLYHSEEDIHLTTEDLLRFGSQAANGMVCVCFFTVIQTIPRRSPIHDTYRLQPHEN